MKRKVITKQGCFSGIVNIVYDYDEKLIHLTCCGGWSRAIDMDSLIKVVWE